MKKKLTEVVFLLDRSGSMAGLEQETIKGYNGFLQKQKNKGESVYITTVLFDDQYEVLHDHLPLEKVLDMDESNYYVRGCTALFDAIGMTIQGIQDIRDEKASGDEQVIFVITTDGLENASREFTCDQIRRMIKYQKELYGWEFIFLGANMDAVEEACKVGIGADRAVTFVNDKDGIALNYEVLAETVIDMRSCASIGAEWKKRIEERNRELHGKE